MSTVIEARNVTRHFTLPRESLFAPPGHVYAVNEVSFSVEKGRSLGVVGESGCGKTTLARLVMALDRPTSGSIAVNGAEISNLSAEALRPLRRDFQMVFQDPYGSLDPRHTVGRIVGEPLEALDLVGTEERRERVIRALESVGLKAADTAKYPHEFSGGQRQRIAIARALVTRPALIVADEPVSALDVSVQAQVLNLLHHLQADFGITYLFISHDLAVVDYVCDEVAVMYLGRIVEQGPAQSLFARPMHPYTVALLDAVPRPEAGRRPKRVLAGGVASQTEIPRGCAFAERCPRAAARCREARPELEIRETAH
ncbi:MAG: ATP-binding cassette domain-containing protein, partial [Alphaproteobacteria bacterium]|nr:ATP-binding cassette domain-containing protein [Alphaproteobacteria bacterium]